VTGIDFAALRQHHPLADVARRTGLAVHHDGGDIMVCCPMPTHNDRTPSMMLHLSTDRFHCFGCGATGDVIQWVRSIYGVPVAEAVRMLERPGPLPPTPPGAVTNRHHTSRRSTSTIRLAQAERPDPARSTGSDVRAALADAWDYYSYGALHDTATGYLAGRGIHVAALEVESGEPVVGHTPHKAPDQLVARLRTKGHSDDVLVDAGLGRRVAGRPLIDTYRRRVLVAVRDDHGAVVGLIGRYDGERVDVPKYLNPPRTAVYDKSVNLYRPTLHRLANDAQVVLCEGTLDALAIAACAAQGGLSAKYAPIVESGLALSPAQWGTILAIHHQPLVICADGDPAGHQASARWATEAALRGRESVITTWPDGHDPASWLAERGVDGLTAVTGAGCLNADRRDLRPRHGAPIVVAALAAEARLAGRPVDLAALQPLGLLTGHGPRTRYAGAAARYLAGGVVNGAIAASDDPAQVAKAVLWWGTARFPDDTREEWVNAAAIELDLAGYGPSARHGIGLRTSTRKTGGAPPPTPHAPISAMAGGGCAVHPPGLTLS
jgi:DNA primase